MNMTENYCADVIYSRRVARRYRDGNPPRPVVNFVLYAVKRSDLAGILLSVYRKKLFQRCRFLFEREFTKWGLRKLFLLLLLKALEPREQSRTGSKTLRSAKWR